jgi:hypothetical protein
VGHRFPIMRNEKDDRRLASQITEATLRLNSGIFLHKVVKIKFFFLSFVNSKQFKYFKTDFQGIIIIVEPAFIWFKNKTGSILGTFPEIPLMWGPQTTFQ